MNIAKEQDIINRIMTARDYIQDGLIAMWDGKENVGWGKHDSNATVWKDLVTLRDANLDPSVYRFGKNYMEKFALTDRLIYQNWELPAITESTLQVIFDVTDIHVDLCFVFCITGHMIPVGYVCVAGADNGYVKKDSFTFGYHAYYDPYGVSGFSLDKNFSITTLSDSETVRKVIINGSERTMDFGANGAGVIGGQLSFLCRANASNQDGVGKIYSVRVYGRMLTAEEIAENYIVDKARFGLK